MSTLAEHRTPDRVTTAARLPKPFWNPYLAGFLLGLVLLGTYLVTGRGLGASFTERPQIMSGDMTVIRPGMVLAVDGNLTIEDFGVQFGDSVVVTETGFEFLTTHRRDIQVV